VAPAGAALLAEALTVAKHADVIVAVVGLSPRLEGEALRIETPGSSAATALHSTSQRCNDTCCSPLPERGGR